MTRTEPNSTERVIVRGGYYHRPIRAYAEDETGQRTTIEEMLGPERLRRLDPLCQCALYAVALARAAADIGDDDPLNEHAATGICFGTAFGAQTARIRFARRLAQYGPASTNPIDFPDSIDGAPAAHIATYWGFQGPALTFVDGPAAATNALIAACRLIVAQRADRMYVVTGDVFDPWLRRCIQLSGNTSSTTSINKTAEAGVAAGSPSDVVLALILERLAGQGIPELPVEIMGFGGASRAQSLPTHLVCDVTPPQKNPADLSGTSQVAGAWLEVTALMGNQTNLCKDNKVRANALLCRLGHERLPELAFVRHCWQT
jgi:hypothetical protein